MNALLNKKTTDKERNLEINALLIDIKAAKSDMEIANANFNSVFTDDDIDIYIYKYREAQSRYGKLLKKLKALS